MKKGPVDVLVVDDHAGFRSAVRTMLSFDDRLDVVGEANSVDEALASCARLEREGHPPELVLIDVNLGDVDGMTGAAAIVAAHPGLAVMTCSTAPLSQLPPLPQHPDISFTAKQELDSETLWEWFRRRRR
jgi:chemotaxis response regulator CheB